MHLVIVQYTVIKIIHPPGRISVPIFSKTCLRGGIHNANGGIGKISSAYSHIQTHRSVLLPHMTVCITSYVVYHTPRVKKYELPKQPPGLSPGYVVCHTPWIVIPHSQQDPPEISPGWYRDIRDISKHAVRRTHRCAYHSI